MDKLRLWSRTVGNMHNQIVQKDVKEKEQKQ